MGTNYYLHTRQPCECCGRPYERIHIGKSSGGWCFALRVMPEENINDLEDWKKLWWQQGAWIEDEYGAKVSVITMEKVITDRGPNGLFRHPIGDGCLKHGEGTWDCIDWEFS